MRDLLARATVAPDLTGGSMIQFMQSSANSGFVLAFLASAILVPCAWATPAQVLLIRHAEKPEAGEDLSPQGYQRAQAYVNYFETNPAVTEYGTPAAIYAMNADDPESSQRPVETVTPLANHLGLSVQTRYAKKDIGPLVSEILSAPAYDGKMVLICWEHKMLSQIAAQFGVNPAPDAYPGDAFNWVWEIDFTGESVSDFKEFQADVLPSDSPPNELFP